MSKIIVIDDDRLVRRVFSAVLKKEGLDVIEADNGDDGLALVISEHPDLVVTDFQMPGKNGLELLSEIQRLKLGIPVIMLTGFGDVSLTIKSIQQGAFDFLEKPVNPDILKITVHKALNSQKQSSELSDVIHGELKESSILENTFLVGKAPRMKEIFKSIGLISMNKVNVMIEGRLEPERS